MKLFALITIFLCVPAEAATVYQLSVDNQPEADSPFADAVHFRYDKIKKTVWIAGNSEAHGFRWSTKTVTEAEGAVIENALMAAGFDNDKEKEKPRSGSATFQFIRDGSKHQWRGYYSYQGEKKDRALAASQTLYSMIEGESSALVKFPPFDGQIKLALDCASLSDDGIMVKAENKGVKSAKLKPVGKHLIAYWGYYPQPEGDAGKEHLVPPGQALSMYWAFDPATFKQSPVRTQLLYLADGFVDTGLPDGMLPAYQSILRCDLPGKATASTPKFDEKAAVKPLEVIEGSWQAKDKDLAELSLYLVVKGSKLLFLGGDSLGEGATAYYAIEAKNMKANAANQLRFEIGDYVDYSDKPFTPKRLSKAKDDVDAGRSRLHLKFEGSYGPKAITLRCTAIEGECPALKLSFAKLF